MTGPAALARAMRPANCIMASAAVWIGGSVSSGEPEPLNVAISSAMASAFFLLAFANVFNDINDRRLDQEKADFRASARRIRPSNSWPMAFALLGISFVSAEISVLSSGTAQVGIIYGLALILIIAYERNLKGLGLPGNISVGVLSGSLFLFGGALHGIDVLTSCIAAAAALASTAREIVKDVEDMDADEGFRMTLPIRAGARKASLVAGTFSCLAVIPILVPFIFGEGGFVYLILTSISSCFAIGLSFGTSIDRSNAGDHQKGIKIAMLVSMAAYVSLFTL